MSETAVKPSMSPWTPLRNNRVFLFLWIATLVSNIGTWMHDVGAGWLVTSLTDSEFVVALMQTATSLPAFFLLLPSGALADIFDRRLYLLTANIGQATVAATLGFLTLSGLIEVWSLLLLTLMLGIGTAMVMPAWQSIIPEVVKREDLSGAIALNTMGMNIARVLGALIAGIIIAAAGPGAVFVTNAVTFTLIIIVLLRWKRQAPEVTLPPEPLIPAVRTGLRYARHSPALLFTIYRSIGFYFFASVMWALFPVIARDLLGADEFGYALLFAFISIGAIINAMFIPRLRARFNNDQAHHRSITGVCRRHDYYRPDPDLYHRPVHPCPVWLGLDYRNDLCADRGANGTTKLGTLTGHRRFPDLLYGLTGYWSRHLGWPGTTDHHSCCYLYCVNMPGSVRLFYPTLARQRQ